MQQPVQHAVLPDTKRLEADLYWAVHSPSVFMPASANVIWPEDHWFSTQQIFSGEELPSPKNPGHFRLGLQFEALIHHWLEHHPDYQILAHNLQVFDNKRTVGEFDLIVKAGSELIEHWELAVKFFICGGDSRNLSHWYGPNTADRLDLKFNRMMQHQLGLSQDEFGRQALTDLHMTPESIRGFAKGRLFYQWSAFISHQFMPPLEVNPLHERGWWIGINEVTQLEFSRIAYLTKTHWLAPVTSADNILIMKREELMKLLSQPELEDASLFALLDQSGQESSRGFILKPNWFSKIEV